MEDLIMTDLYIATGNAFAHLTQSKNEWRVRMALEGIGVLRDANPDTRVVALEPDTSPVLSGGKAGSHRIDGTAAGFVPPQFDRAIVTDVMALPEKEARQMRWHGGLRERKASLLEPRRV